VIEPTLTTPFTASTDLLEIEDLLKIKTQPFKERNVSSKLKIQN